MIIRNPYDRDDLNIGKKDRVLEVGSGHNPTYRADVIVEQYMETPSLLGEFLFPKKSHKWIILYLDKKLILFEKSRMPGNYENNYGELFLNYLPYQSLTYKLLWLTEGDLMLNRCEWKDNIEFIVNPIDEKYTDFFTKPWSRQMVEQLYPRRSAVKELKKVGSALYYMIKNKVKNKTHRHVPITLEEYMKNEKKK